MPEARFSVLLPVYNGERYLAECIESVLTQDFSDFELLIGDDRSTDGTLALVGRYADSRIRVFRSESNLGLFGNVNRLVQAAKGSLVRILCQDDKLEPNCLSEEVKFFSRQPTLGMAYCNVVLVDAEGRQIHQVSGGDKVIEPHLSLQHFYYDGCLPGNLSAVSLRRDCFQKYGLFDERFTVSGDYEMWVRVCKERDMGVIGKPLVRIRNHQAQLSRTLKSGVEFVAQNRNVRALAFKALDPEAQARGRFYTLFRQNVFDAHFALKLLLSLHPFHAWKVARTMGMAEFLSSVFFWALTLNNHLWRPARKFVIRHPINDFNVLGS